MSIRYLAATRLPGLGLLTFLAAGCDAIQVRTSVDTPGHHKETFSGRSNTKEALESARAKLESSEYAEADVENYAERAGAAFTSGATRHGEVSSANLIKEAKTVFKKSASAHPKSASVFKAKGKFFATLASKNLAWEALSESQTDAETVREDARQEAVASRHAAFKAEPSLEALKAFVSHSESPNGKITQKDLFDACKATRPTVKEVDDKYELLSYCLRASGSKEPSTGLSWASGLDRAFFAADLARRKREQAAADAAWRREQANAPAQPSQPAKVNWVNVEVKNECNERIEYCIDQPPSTLNTSANGHTTTTHTAIRPGSRIQLKKGGQCSFTIYTVGESNGTVVLCN